VSAKSVRLPGEDAGIARYLAEIRRFPLLEPEVEHSLATRYREHRDEAAARRLISSHLRLAVKIAFDYRGYRLPLSDLISEGQLGLLEALKNFDPNRGARFATYATWWVRAQIQAYVLRSRSLVKMGTTNSQRKLFFNLARVKAQLGFSDDADIGPAEAARIASVLQVPRADVVSMNGRLAASDASLQTPLSEDGAEWQESLADEREDQETQLGEREQRQAQHALLQRAIQHLDPREREILQARWLREQPPSLAMIAERFGVSQERIRQIELRALAKLQKLAKRQELARAPAPAARAA
jgi:RNA polymerase sigma-32 factor